MRRRFFWGAVAVAVITLAVGGVAAAVLIHRSVEQSIRSEFGRQAAATARIIESRFLTGGDDAPFDRPLEGLGEVLALVRAVGGHDYVEAALVDRDGAVHQLADASRVLMPQIPEDADLSRGFTFDADVDGEQVAAMVVPVGLDRRGSIVIVIGTELELIPWGDVLLRFGWAVALGMVLAALLAGLLAERVARRVAPLSEASHRLAAGERDVRVQIDGADEIAEAAASFNVMAANLEAAQAREREFLASVGHDLRTPLTTIAGYAEAMREGRVDPGELERVATVLDTEAGRLKRLVEDLMLLSRLEAREFTMRPEEVDIAAHLKSVLESFRTRADAARIELVAALDEVGTVSLDPDRTAQVVGNLLENALRYTPEAGRVTLGLRRERAAIALTVSDTGPGIGPEDLPHIFERLYVTARYRPLRPEGSGLGLSIVHELVGAMGGTTLVESEIGKGTTIEVLLPA